MNRFEIGDIVELKVSVCTANNLRGPGKERKISFRIIGKEPNSCYPPDGDWMYRLKAPSPYHFHPTKPCALNITEKLMKSGIAGNRIPVTIYCR